MRHATCDMRQGPHIENLLYLVRHTALDKLPVFPVSAVTGAGIDNLKDHLLAAATDLPPRPVTGNFRLAIDRSFDVVGAGLVVTGDLPRLLQFALPWPNVDTKHFGLQ